MLRKWLCVFCVLAAGGVGSAVADEVSVHPAFDKLVPDSLEDLRAIEARVEAITTQAAAATVSLEIFIEDERGGKLSAGTGSGVVVGTQGYILTAAHVIGEAGNEIEVTFPDGRVETAVSLGSDQQNDAGLAKLQGEGPWPHVEMAEPDTLSYGDWVVALGHPGGFDIERSVVVRLGRVLRIRQIVGVMSDCSLIGGDSGGPLFNMDGKVVAIHSRIGQSERSNIHVPIGEYHKNWKLLVESQQWGEREAPFLGVRLAQDPESRGILIRQVLRRTAASRAGIRIGDVLTHVDDQPVRDDQELLEIFALKVPGDPVVLTLIRGDQTIVLDAELGGTR